MMTTEEGLCQELTDILFGNFRRTPTYTELLSELDATDPIAAFILRGLADDRFPFTACFELQKLATAMGIAGREEDLWQTFQALGRTSIEQEWNNGTVSGAPLRILRYWAEEEGATPSAVELEIRIGTGGLIRADALPPDAGQPAQAQSKRLQRRAKMRQKIAEATP